MNQIPFTVVVERLPKKRFFSLRRYRVVEGYHRFRAHEGKWIYCHVIGLPHPIWIRKSRLGA